MIKFVFENGQWSLSSDTKMDLANGEINMDEPQDVLFESAQLQLDSSSKGTSVAMLLDGRPGMDWDKLQLITVT